MPVNNDKFMHFRNERARELKQMADLLNRHLSDVNTNPIYEAVANLKNAQFIPQLKDNQRHENIWGYDIDGFEIPLETIKHVKPEDIRNGQAILSLRMRADIKKWNTFEDPLIELGFNVMIKGVGSKVYHFGFHIDKHTGGAGAGKNDEAEPHPVYHLQYNLNPTKSNAPDLGSLFYIDTPRIMHKPLEFILGVSFLTCNFYPTAYKVLIEDREFDNLTRRYQESIWRPYFHTLANHWKPFTQTEIIWSPVSTLCPVFR